LPLFKCWVFKILLFMNLVFIKKIVSYCTLIFLLAACKKPQGFDFRETRNIKINQVGFDKTAISLDMVYYNPNDFGVDLRKVDCTIFVENNYLGKYKLDTLMHIPRKSEFILPSKMEVEMKGIFKNALTAIFNKEIKLDIKGNCKVGKAGIFVTIPVNYSTKYSFNLFQ
jgi:LEA14-like dessication related protein